MPLRLVESHVTPPGYWQVTEADGTVITGGDIGDLIGNVTDYRIANNIPLGDVEADTHEFICRHTEARCRPAKPQGGLATIKPSAIAVARFLKAMTAWLKSSGTVEQEEAERRAEICAGCRFQANLDDANCFGCFQLAARIMQAIGSRRTRMDESLKFCSICSCANSVSVFAPLDVLQRAHAGLEFPEDTGQRDENGNPVPCWKRAK